MSKGGFTSILPFLLPAAALATGGLAAPALFAGEAAGLGAGEAALGAGTAAGLAEGGGALPTAGALLAAPETAAVGAGVTTPLSAGALSGFSDAAISGLPDAVSGLGGTAGVAPGATAGTLTQAVGEALPFSDFTGGTLGPGNAFGLPGGSVVEGPTPLAAPIDPPGAVAPASDFAPPPDLAAGESDFSGEVVGGGDWFSKATQALNNPLARAGVAGGGLLASGLLNKGTPVGSAPISAAAGVSTANAAALRGQSNQNLGALNTGALPAGAASAIKQSTDAAKASIRSKFAGMGLSGSSMEGQELAAVDQQAGAMRLAQAEQLTTLGLEEARLASGEGALATEDYMALMNARLRQDDRLAQALARFSGAMAGGTVSRE